MTAPGRRTAWAVKLSAGLLLFWIAFRDVDPAAIGRAFAGADRGLLAAASVSVFLTVGCVVMRWGTLLASDARHTSVLFSAVIASQVANIVMPFRLGDAVRIGAVSRALGVPPAEVLGSVAVERLFDALLVAVTASLLVLLGALPPFAHAGLLSLAAAIALAFVVIGAALMRAGAPLDSAGGRVSRMLPARVFAWLSRQSNLLVRGIRRAGEPRIAGRAFLWSAAVMAGSIFTAWLVLRALDIGAPALSAAVVVIAVQIGGAVVPIPGAVGISQILTVQTLRLWDVPEPTALAYALMLYLVSRLPKIAILPFVLPAITPASETETPWPR
ncbi:MAG: flippase-like domain-containing protein [Acidobacteriota bacterium]|nr:flippase-like domain-containing protein [Acidobacteriota bacterium]